MHFLKLMVLYPEGIPWCVNWCFLLQIADLSMHGCEVLLIFSKKSIYQPAAIIYQILLPSLGIDHL